MSNEITIEQAIALSESAFWEEMDYRDRAIFQINTPKLCMPFSVFHEALEKALGRPVWTHELGLDVEGLKKELMGERPAPTFAEIVGLIPEEKHRVIALVGPDSAA